MRLKLDYGLGSNAETVIRFKDATDENFFGALRGSCGVAWVMFGETHHGRSSWTLV